MYKRIDKNFVRGGFEIKVIEINDGKIPKFYT
jgi:hypothetical protein